MESPLADTTISLTETLLLARPDSPLRSPSWRWLRANLRAQGRVGAQRRREDQFVCVLADWLRADRSVKGRFRGVGPRLRRALLLWESRSTACHELEARLLAGQDTPEIAARLGLPAGLVDVYHDVFFDIRPRLGCRSYILRAVFGDGIRPGKDSGFDPYVLMKFIAFTGGKDVLEAYLWYLRTPQPTVPRRLGPLPDDELERLALWYSVHRWVLSVTVDAFTDRDKIQFAHAVLGR